MGNCCSEEDGATYLDVLGEVTPPAEVPAPLALPTKRVSVGETKCREVVDTVLKMKGISPKVVQYNFRPSYLRNPETNRCLELDIYVELHDGTRFAIEFNGKQHYEYTSVFHKTAGDFHAQQVRDSLKEHLCNTERIHLLVIPYNYSDRMIENAIMSFLS